MNDTPDTPRPARTVGADDRTEHLDSAETADAVDAADTAATPPSAQQAGPVAAQSATGRLLRALAVMASGTMLSKILGFTRVALAAYVIGNGTRQADMYAVATTVPTALYILFAGGALNSVLVPQLTRAAKHDADGGEAYTNRIVTAFLMILLVVTLVVTVAAPAVTGIYAADSWRTPELEAHYRAMVLLTMVCLPEIFFYGTFVVLGQILNARDRFGPMMWAPVASNLIQVGSFVTFLVVWGQSSGDDPFTSAQIATLGGGYLVGMVLQAGVMVWCLRRVGYRYKPRFDLKGTGLGKTFKLAGWAVGFVLVNQVALAVVSRLATSATAGGSGAGLTVYNNAYLVFLLPHSLITVSLATAMVTSASKLAAEGDLTGTAAEVMRTIRLVATALVPAAVLFLALAGPLAQLLFGHGTGADDAVFISWTIMAFAVGLVPFTIQHVCLRTYYALERNRTTFFIQLAIAAVQIAAALALVLPFDNPALVAPALALSFSSAYVFGLFVSFRHLRTLLPALRGGEVVRHLARVLVAVLPGAVAAWLLASWLDDSTLNRLVGLTLGGLVAAGGYLLMARLLHIREITEILSRLRRRSTAEPADDAAGPGPTGRGHAAAGPDPDDDRATRVHPALVDPVATRVAPPVDPDVPTAAVPAYDDDRTQVRAAVDPDALTEAYATAAAEDDGVSGDNRASDIESSQIEGSEKEGSDDMAEPSPEDTAEETHPIRVHPGRILGGRYKLEHVLVRRTRTQTWRAIDQVLSRPVLIHLLPPGEDDHELLATAKRAAVATDSRFLRVLDAHTGDEPAPDSSIGDDPDAEPEAPLGPYIVCEYAPGQTLERLLAAGPLSALEAAWLVREVADGLAGMHEQGLYHERINPDTVVITATGNVKIVGFLLESELGPTHHPLTDGSDPEAVDITDLGRLLYCTLVSRWPGGHGYGMAAAPVDSEGQLLTPRQVRAGVSPALDTICDRILSPIPRYRETPLRTAHDVVRALNQVLGTADAAQDLERRLRYPVTVVEVDEAEPPVTAGQPSVETATGLPLAPFADPDAPTGRIPVLPADSELPTGPLLPVSQSTPAEPDSSSDRRTVHHGGPVVRPDPPRRWIPALIVLTVLVLLGSLLAVALTRGFGGGTADDAPPEPLQIVNAVDFDPQGNTREENPEQAPLARDGDPQTAWMTVAYAQPDMSGKDGVGILFDLGEVRELSRADVLLAGDGTSVELRMPLTDPETIAEAPTQSVEQWRPIAAAAQAPRQTTLTPEQPVRTRFVLVFLTELPADGATFRGGIAEAAFFG